MIDIFKLGDKICDMLQPKTREFVLSLPFFSGLTEKDVQEVLALSEFKDFNKGDTIFLQDDAANHFYIILEGWVKLFRGTISGDEVVISVFTSKETFGDAAMFDGAVYPYSAEAAGETKLIVMPAAKLRKKAAENPQIALRMMQSLSKNMNRLQLENEHMALMTAPQRIGCLFLQLSPDADAKSHTLQLPYDKSLAATRLGMKPETFSRALVQLKEVGVSVKGNTVIIPDLSALVEFTCNSCSAQDDDCRFSQVHHCTPDQCAKCKVHKIKD